MAKFQFACVLLLIAFVAIGCDAKKLKVRPVRLIQRHRHLSRQEAEPVTPYPTATELKPEIPFDEGIPADVPAPEEVFPEGEEHIPDEVYGPPDATYIPDEVYGPPELDGNALPTEDFYTFQRVRKAYLIRRKAAALHQLKMTKLSKFSQLAKLIKAAKLAKLSKFGKLTLLKKKIA